MKRWLPVAGALVAVLALLGVMYVLRQEPAELPEATLQADPTPLPMYVLLDNAEEQPEQITITCDGKTSAYAFNQLAGTYGAIDYDERLAFNQEELQRLFESCTRLVSRKIIDEKPADLAVYGLDDPISTVTVQYADGNRHEIRVGARSPLEDGYFGMLDADPTVYLLMTYDAESFIKQLPDFRTFSLFHDLGNDAENYALSVQELVIDAEEQKIRFYRPAAGANGEVYGIEILEPVEVAGDEYAFYQKVVNPIFSLRNARLQLVEDLPDDLARYGLETPQATLLLKDDMGKTRLLIGTEEEGRTYLMREGIPAVLSVKSSALSFLTMDYTQVMDRLVWIYNIDQVDSLTVTYGGRTDTLEVRGGTGFWFNGTPVDEETGRELYRCVISLTYDDRASETAIEETPACEMTFSLLDGSKTSLALYALNERHFEVVRDGQSTGFYINKSYLTNIAKALEALYEI
ncbi:MAG: DUF4340 domain-containing protein [Clostridiales bacterium]|nr:DUF4340 domain-containing protein [Clostridiales bacterium]